MPSAREDSTIDMVHNRKSGGYYLITKGFDSLREEEEL